jgi:Holliday junction resolvase
MTQYARGRRKEWDVCKRLRDRGWLATRSAGSHGLWDVVAVRRGRPPVFVQVKYTARKSAWQDGNARELLGVAVEWETAADFEVWVYTKGRAAPEVFTPEWTYGRWYWEINTELTAEIARDAAR